MKNKSKLVIILLFVLSFAFTACNDWAEIESVTIKEPNIAEQNPELYTKYLENLRQYKKSEHRVTYVSFDNSLKGYESRADHLTDLSDSIDVVSLLSPELTSNEVKEMELIQVNKGTKVIYAIEYADIEVKYALKYPEIDEKSAQDESYSRGGANDLDEPLLDDSFLSFMNEYMDIALAWCDRYGYDGLNICYTPKNVVHMEEAPQRIERNRQNAFMKRVSDWMIAHENKIFLFEGNLIYLIDKTILNDCEYLVVNASNSRSVEDFTFQTKKTIVEGIPTDRFIVCVPTFSLNTEDNETGYILNSQGYYISAIQAAAFWALSPELGLQKSGIGIYNVKNDYYNSAIVYSNIRRAISIMNPSPNN